MRQCGATGDSIIQLVTQSALQRVPIFHHGCGRDALVNLSQLTKPNLRYMGTEDLILDLELMCNIFQTQIHNLRLAR